MTKNDNSFPAFRTLQANEIECRIGTQRSNYVTLLLYKDARVDQRLLDETVGPMNWKRDHQLINGNLYCTISIYDPGKKEWVGKQDVGTESNTEKEKGQASDAFKRAGFNWGIGRELYSSPAIFIGITANDLYKDKVRTRFFVKEIEYNDDREITKVVIVDDQGNQRYPAVQSKPAQSQQFNLIEQTQEEKEKVDEAIEDLRLATTFQEFREAGERHKDCKRYKRFYDAAVMIGQQFRQQA